MTQLEKQVALITGGSRGLGLALARRLTHLGWLVIVDARNGRDLETAVADLPSAAVVKVQGDVADPSHRSELIAAAESAGRLDLVVNNASILGPSPQPALAGYPLETLREVYETNTIAPLAIVQDALPFLRSSGGIVVNITSDAAVEPYEGWGGYGSSKAALDQITSILAAEEPDISVYAFDPGDMNTRMHQEAFPGEDISDRPHPETVVPALVAMLERRPLSGRYSATDILQAT